MPSGAFSYLTLWAHGLAQPAISALNAQDGAVTGNMAIVPTIDGSISAYATQATQVIFDIFGYFAP